MNGPRGQLTAVNVRKRRVQLGRRRGMGRGTVCRGQHWTSDLKEVNTPSSETYNTFMYLFYSVSICFLIQSKSLNELYP